MAPWKGSIPTVVLLLLGSISSNVHAEITKTPSSGLFLNGSDVTLSCTVEGNNYVLWDDLSDATSIFIGKEKNTEKKKYDNFEISSGDEDFSLIIRDVQLSDEGTYVCKDRDRLANATVTVGVLPTLHLCVKESEATDVPQSSTKVNITCSAYNAKPAVSVFELSVIGTEKTVNITNDKSNQNEDGKTYNSSASLPYIVSSEEMSVYCRVFTAGRSLKHTEKFNIPRCNITISGNEIRCLCQANPPVSQYYMDVNGHKHDGDVFFIEEDHPMNIRCFATNELGTGQSDLLFPDDIYGFGLVPIAVVVTLVVLLLVLTVLYMRRRLCPRDKKSDEEQPKVHGANEEESVNLLSQSESKPNEKGQQEDTEDISEGKHSNDEVASDLPPKPDSTLPRIDLTCELKDPQRFINKILLQVKKDWEIFAIEVLNISAKVVEEAVIQNDNFEDQITAVTENMMPNHAIVLDENAKLCKEFDLEIVKDENGCFLQHTNNSRADLVQQTAYKQDPMDISSSKRRLFSTVLLALDHLIGNVGQARLLQSYSETKDNKRNACEHLRNTGRLKDNQQMLTELSKNLQKCHLLSAWKRLSSYTESKTFDKVLSNISHGMECDWEIFAVIDLKLKEDDVVQIISREKTVEDQIRSALDLWTKENNCKEYEQLLNIVLVSSVCNDTEHNSCWRRLSGYQQAKTGSAVDDQNTNERNCERLQNPDDVFNEMIQSVSVMIGNTGAFYLLQAYTDACDQNEVKEKDARFQNKEFDGEILLKYLMESGRLSDNAKSLDKFRIRLTEANLFRVRIRLDEYISQQQKSNDDRCMVPNSSITKDEKVQ